MQDHDEIHRRPIRQIAGDGVVQDAITEWTHFARGQAEYPNLSIARQHLLDRTVFNLVMANPGARINDVVMRRSVVNALNRLRDEEQNPGPGPGHAPR